MRLTFRTNASHPRVRRFSVSGAAACHGTSRKALMSSSSSMILPLAVVGKIGGGRLVPLALEGTGLDRGAAKGFLQLRDRLVETAAQALAGLRHGLDDGAAEIALRQPVQAPVEERHHLLRFAGRGFGPRLRRRGLVGLVGHLFAALLSAVARAAPCRPRRDARGPAPRHPWSCGASWTCAASISPVLFASLTSLKARSNIPQARSH